MGDSKEIVWVIVILGVLVLSYFILTNFTSGVKSEEKAPASVSEPYENFPSQWSPELDAYFMNPNEGIKPYEVDQMTCSPKCCGVQWPTPFDGLSAEQIQYKISTQESPGPFVRTDMTCANGPGGVGCPCVSTDAYLLMTNHGTLPDYPERIEPTFLIPGDMPQMPSGEFREERSLRQDRRERRSRDNVRGGRGRSRSRSRDDGRFGQIPQGVGPIAQSKMQSDRERVASAKSSYTKDRKMNDMDQWRPPVPASTISNVRGTGSVM